MSKFPNGRIDVGYFNNQGSGKVYFSSINSTTFIEGLHFIFYENGGKLR